MNIHEDARTYPHSRRLIAQRRDQGWSRAAVAEAFGISERMVTRWHRRYEREGEVGLGDRSSAPTRSPRRLSRTQQLYIAWLRRAFGWTVEGIARQSGLSRSRVARWLARWGLSERGCRMRRRYERERPGDLLHLDIKKLARFHRPGHRVTGDRRVESRGAGYAFVHVGRSTITRASPTPRSSTTNAASRPRGSSSAPVRPSRRPV